MAIADPTAAPARPSRKRRKQQTNLTPPPRRSRKRRARAVRPEPARPAEVTTVCKPAPRPRAKPGSRSHQPDADHPPLWDARGYRRSTATLPEYHRGRSPKSKGQKYPRNPPTIGEVIRLINGCEDTPYGRRRRALIIVLWRTGIRISEALALVNADLQEDQGAIVVRHGKGDKFRVVGMDSWGWNQIRPWLDERRQYPPGPVFCVLDGPTAGRAWEGSCFRSELHKLGAAVGIDKRLHPHCFRHAFATERYREKRDIGVIQKQLGHASRHITYRYITEMTIDEVLDEARTRQLPSVNVTEVMDMLIAPTP